MTDLITANVNPTYRFLSSQIDLVGSRDPNAVLAATGDALQTIIDGHDAESMRRRVKEDSWTPVEIVAHLADMEWIFGFRARTILCDDRPQLSEIDQDDWIRVQQPNQRDPRDLHPGVKRRRNFSFSLVRCYCFAAHDKTPSW